MLPITGNSKTKRSAVAEQSARGGIVLPKFLRRPVRLVRRAVENGSLVHALAMPALVLGVILLAGIAGSVAGNKILAYSDRALSASGLRVRSIQVEGNHEVSKLDVLQSVGFGDRSMIAINVGDIRGKIRNLAWVRDATVRKIYPGTLSVAIKERAPFAIWQHGSQLTLVAQDGQPIAPYDSRFADLPLVVGEGAAKRAAGFIAVIARFGEIAPKVRAYIRVADRRWNLQLTNGMTINLPSAGQQAALLELSALARENDLLARDVAIVDMRLSDRLVIRPRPKPAETNIEAHAGQSKQEAKL